MKKTFKLRDLDCAACAAKMEAAIAKLPDVEAVSVNFMLQKMTLQAPDERFDAVLEAAKRTIAKVEPDCEVLVK